MSIIKKTQIKDLLSLIKRNIASYIVLAVLFGAATAMFCGGSWSCLSQKKEMNHVLSSGKSHTLEYVLPYGLGDKDLKTVIDDDSDLIIDGGYTDYGYFFLDDKYQSIIVSLNENMDLPIEIVGTLPNKNNEIAVRKSWADKHDFTCGDTIRFSDEENSAALLINREFTITALIETTSYLPTLESYYGNSPYDNMPIDCVMYVSKDSFDSSKTNGYTNIFVYDESLNDADVFSDEYKKSEKELKEKLESKINDLYNAGYNKTKEKIAYVYGINLSDVDLEDIGYTTFLKSDNSITLIYDLLNNILSKVRSSLTALFIVVSLFVGYSVISRMVRDHIKLIGMKTANGMTKWEVFKPYLFFCMTALIIGAFIVGLAISCLYIYVMHVATSSTYYCPVMYFSFGFEEFITIFALLFVFVIIVTLISVFNIIKLRVVQQLQGEVPVYGKNRLYEKFKFWNHLKVLTKTIVNNLFNEKRRAIGTLLGVAGSTALVVASFTFSNLVLNSYNAHFENIYHFNTLIQYSASEETKNDISNYLDEKEFTYADVYLDHIQLEFEDGKKEYVTLFVYNNQSAFEKLVSLYSDDGETFGKGMYLSYAMEKEYQLKKDTELNYLTTNGSKGSVNIDGYYVNNLFQAVAFCDIDTYKDSFKNIPESNSFIAYTDENIDEINQHFKNDQNFYKAIDYKDKCNNAFEIIQSVLTMMKIVFLTVAIGMALMVLYNLITVFIVEKKRDLITLMINGYDMKYVRNYILSDTITLTSLGIIIGIVIGEIFGNFTANSFASSQCRFMNGLDLMGMIGGILIIVSISIIVCLMLFRKVNKFKLSDINT